MKRSKLGNGIAGYETLTLELDKPFSKKTWLQSTEEVKDDAINRNKSSKKGSKKDA